MTAPASWSGIQTPFQVSNPKDNLSTIYRRHPNAITIGAETKDPINSAWPFGRARILDFKSDVNDLRVGTGSLSNILSAHFMISESLVESLVFALQTELIHRINSMH